MSARQIQAQPERPPVPHPRALVGRETEPKDSGKTTMESTTLCPTEILGDPAPVPAASSRRLPSAALRKPSSSHSPQTAIANRRHKRLPTPAAWISTIISSLTTGTSTIATVTSGLPTDTPPIPTPISLIPTVISPISKDISCIANGIFTLSLALFDHQTAISSISTAISLLQTHISAPKPRFTLH